MKPETVVTWHRRGFRLLWTCVVPTATYRLLFVLVILAHDRRRIVHVAVTAQPTAAWTAQQLREAFPEDAAPRYLLHAQVGGLHHRYDRRAA